MSEKTHYRTQIYPETGYAETTCGLIIRIHDTTTHDKMIDCKTCLKKLRKLQNAGPN